MFNILGCFACCRPSRMWITFNRFLTIFEDFVLHFYLHCTHCIIPESLLSHLNISTEEYSGLMQNLMQSCSSTHSVILNVTATQYTYSLNGVYRPHWLAQWSHHCTRMCIPVRSPGLPAYIDVTPTILVVLTMVGLFLDRPYIYHRYAGPSVWFMVWVGQSGKVWDFFSEWHTV